MRNHPLVRITQVTSRVGALRLDVGNQSAFLSGEEALRLHADMEKLLVLRGLLPAREPVA